MDPLASASGRGGQVDGLQLLVRDQPLGPELAAEAVIPSGAA